MTRANAPTLPDAIESIEQLEDLLSRPSPAAIAAMAELEGDLLVLGVAGKMGPTLARMAVRASALAGRKRRVIGVSRFSKSEDEAALRAHGVETVRADLLDPDQLARLPDAPNVVYMAGMKFGATGNEPLTWAMNVVLPAMVCQRYGRSRIAAFSTGNVYGLVPGVSGGSIETDAPNPTGEYAMSCLGRERVFQHFAQAAGTPVSIIRLNYACELRYGVLVDLARKIQSGTDIDLAMGAFNVIWQADANAMSLASLADAASPAFVVNVAGPESLGVRRASEQLGAILGRRPTFVGAERPDALLNNAQLAHRLYGYPSVPVAKLIEWIGRWVAAGGASLGKPTHFEVRDGKF